MSKSNELLLEDCLIYLDQCISNHIGDKHTIMNLRKTITERLLSPYKSSLEKPDFEKFWIYFLHFHDGIHERWEKQAAQNIWNDYVSPIQGELSKVNDEIRIMCSCQINQKIEIDSLKSELTDAKELLIESKDVIDKRFGQKLIKRIESFLSKSKID